MIDDWMWLIWLGVFVIALIIEALESEIVSIWFSIAAIIALIISFFTTWWIQLIIFIVTSTVMVILLRPILKKLTFSKPLKSNIDEIISKRGIVTKKATKLENGRCKINDVTWTIVPIDDQDIEEGEIIEVVSVSGNKLYVKKANDNADDKEVQQ